MNYELHGVKIEDAKKLTQEFRDKIPTLKGKHAYFDAKKGVCIKAKRQIHNIRAGEVAMIIRDMPNHDVYIHPEEHLRYCSYNGKISNFEPATEQEINALFGVKAEIDEKTEDKTGDNDVQPSEPAAPESEEASEEFENPIEKEKSVMEVDEEIEHNDGSFGSGPAENDSGDSQEVGTVPEEDSTVEHAADLIDEGPEVDEDQSNE